MSDLNDLIARNAVLAFNEGYRTGVNTERIRIVAIIDAVAKSPAIKAAIRKAIDEEATTENTNS